MIRHLTQRAIGAILTLWVVSLLIFGATEVLPGDVASAILGQSRTPEAEAAIRSSLGLDRPVLMRYTSWLADFVHGDVGKSLVSRREIAPLIRERLANTLFLAALAAAIAVPLSVGLGIYAAMSPNGAFDRVINAATLTAISFPEFFVGYSLVVIFAVKLRWFPSLAMVRPDMGLADRLLAVMLPAMTLVAVVFAHMMRQTRAAVLNVLSAPFIEMAVLKGLPNSRVVVRHALPNAFAPIINVVALNLAYLIVGTVVVEVVFVYPGIGQLMVDAVSKRDVPLVQACGMIFGVAYVGLNATADFLGVMSNPRLRLPR